VKNSAIAWLAAAEDDLILIREISSNQSLTHLVAFHAQQAIEKAFKAVIEQHCDNVPRIHALETLLPKVHPYVSFAVEFELLEDLDKLYIDARYPGDFGLLPNGKPTLDDAAQFKELAEDVFTTISKALAG